MLASLLGGCLVHLLVGSLEEKVGFLSSMVQPANVIALYKHTTAPFIDLDDVCGKV